MTFVARLGLILILAVGALSARAEDKIWSALVLGTNEKAPKPVPSELSPYAAGLKAVFGANTFYLLGTKTKKLREGVTEWILPSREVFLKLRCLDRAAAAYTVQIELYVKKRLVVTSKVSLARGAPLFIRGPAWGRGRLLFVLEVR